LEKSHGILQVELSCGDEFGLEALQGQQHHAEQRFVHSNYGQICEGKKRRKANEERQEKGRENTRAVCYLI
jgi:hypothetical protein